MTKNRNKKTVFLSPALEVLSGMSAAEAVRIPPDLGLCDDCLKELYAEADPRCQHPFISCAHCGPRFSIIERKQDPQKNTGRADASLSYERDATSMAAFPMCGFCDVQYSDKEDRRYHAPAISCHACGPKLRWQKQAPQIPETDAADGSTPNPDEDTNAALQMILGRSAHLRSAPDDSPAARHTSADDRRILDEAAQILSESGIIAFKTFNGYYLAADPFHEDAPARLKKILDGCGATEKTGAMQNSDAVETTGDTQVSGASAVCSASLPVLFRDLGEIRYYLRADETAEKLLTSSARPIVLLEHRLNDPGFSKSAGRRFPMTDEGTPEPSFEYLREKPLTAALLPSMAAQYLLLDRISPLLFAAVPKAGGSPVDAAGSAKAGGSPLTDDAEMLAWFEQEPGIGGILYHDVQIHAGLADSVMQIRDGQPQMLVRAKGFVPLPVILAGPDDVAGKAGNSDSADPGEGSDVLPDADAIPEIFAAGTEQKSSFVLSKGTSLYPSQPLENLKTAAGQRAYRETFARMEDLLDIHPKLTVCDMDPLSETTRFTKTYAVEHSLPLLQVQKDHARIASVMAEHALTGPVIGVSFGAPGHGTDGALWGGDILLCEGAGCKRMSHLKYSNVKSSNMKSGNMKDGSLLLTEGTVDAAADESGCQQFALDLSDILEFAGLRTGDGEDAVADGAGAEGTGSAADAAGSAADAAGLPTVRSCSMFQLMDTVTDLLGVDRSLEEAAVFAKDHPGEDPACDLALAFYNRIIDAIVGECVRIRREYDTDLIALSGSCFTSRILLEGALQKLRGLGFKVFFNNVISPDDSCVAVGQAYIAMQAYAAMQNR